MNHKEKEVALSKRESDGLKEDNDRIHRMYMLMQKEAFPNSAAKAQQAPSSVQLKAPPSDRKSDEPIYVKPGMNQ